MEHGAYLHAVQQVADAHAGRHQSQRRFLDLSFDCNFLHGGVSESSEDLARSIAAPIVNASRCGHGHAHAQDRQHSCVGQGQSWTPWLHDVHENFRPSRSRKYPLTSNALQNLAAGKEGGGRVVSVEWTRWSHSAEMVSSRGPGSQGILRGGSWSVPASSAPRSPRKNSCHHWGG